VKHAKKTATTKTRTRTPRARAGTAPARTAGGSAKAGRVKLSLLEKLEAVGLLETDAVERLAGKTDAIAGPQGLERSTAWDRELIGLLDAFAAAGGDGGAKKTLAPLLAWQETLMTLPASREGIQDALAALRKAVPYHGASVYLRDPDRAQVDHLISVGFEVDLISRIRFFEGSGFSSWVAARKKPVLYASLHRNEAPGSEHVRSFMAVPLLVGGECLGVLNLGHREENAYDPASLRRLIVAAGVLSGLVQRYVARGQIDARETRDPVTGFATPAYFRARLEEEVVRCRELGHAMSLLVLRLNELPAYTEQFGEEFRERSRAELAHMVAAWRRPTEVVGHGEGDALFVIVPGGRQDKGESRGAALAAMAQKHNFPRRKRLTVGYAVATYPSDAETPQELMAAVDKSLREASRPQTGGEGLSNAAALAEPESPIAPRIS
jgi:diguanylate cyclase (GGDEF)-like protein